MTAVFLARAGVEIGARLRVTREYSGLLQADVGDNLGVGHAAISRYEAGRREMEYSVLIRFILAFQVTADWILLGDPGGLDPEMRRHLSAHHPTLVRTLTRLRQESGGADEGSAGAQQTTTAANGF